MCLMMLFYMEALSFTLDPGSKELIKQGAVVTRPAALEDPAVPCTGKTAALTKNGMETQSHSPVLGEDETQLSLLRLA